MKKPSLLLLDSDVIIHCHELGVWKSLKAKFSIYVTTIVTEEVRFYCTPNGRERIDLNSEAEAGEITVVEASASEMAAIANLFVPNFSQGLDDGETEGLAVLRRGDLEGLRFSSGDSNGLQAVGMLDLAQHVISLEEILEFAGIRKPSPLTPQYSKRSLGIHVEKGKARRLTNEYFRRPAITL